MTKNIGNDGKGHYKEREVKVILESLEGQFRVFGEGLTDVRDRLEKVEEKIEKLDVIERDVQIIKLVIPTLATKSDLNAIKLVIPTLATKNDLHAMEKRLTVLEHSR